VATGKNFGAKRENILVNSWEVAINEETNKTKRRRKKRGDVEP